jgi:SAM-dependent methyltransferase
MTGTPFDTATENYDRWYDSPEGARVFEAEVASLRQVCPLFAGDWLEIGVGTGRFATALGIAEGIDPSPEMLRVAAKRGINTRVGVGENLPYGAHALEGILMVASLCFVADPLQVMRECARVLRGDGVLLIGHIPSDGPWGRSYVKKAASGHPVYSHARFTTVAEATELASAAGFSLQSAASTLFWSPGDPPGHPSLVESGIVPGAGFVALTFSRLSQQPLDCTRSDSRA